MSKILALKDQYDQYKDQYKQCIRKGDIHQLKRLKRLAPIPFFAGDWAAERGELDMLEFIVSNQEAPTMRHCMYTGWWSRQSVNNVARNGDWEIIKFIHNNGGDISKSADWAAWSGNFPMFKWIMENGGEITHFAADLAAQHGHLEMLKHITSIQMYWSTSLRKKAH